eukprot:GCRY01001975.1.p1 GENE.GCRY01001975.1~~GCRY01001975.1.p1  ORF type:complete len:588 (+),score=148.91 GCRY01001975.1:228-1991(+)
MSASPSKNSKQSKWLDAWVDTAASLQTFTELMALGDVLGDAEDRLLIGNLDEKLKVYKGTNLASEITLLSTPTALCVLYIDENIPRTPALAVSIGSSIFIYRNLRPFAKFTLPDVKIAPEELEIWEKLKTNKIDLLQAQQEIQLFKESSHTCIEGVSLTYPSLHLLTLSTDAEAKEYIAAQGGDISPSQPIITCMASVRKSHEVDDALAHIVVGTEEREIVVLDARSKDIILRVPLPSVPVQIHAGGLYDVEYRLTILCRDGRVRSVKNHELVATILDVDSQITGMLRLGNNVLLSCTDQTLQAFHIKGKKRFSLTVPAPITCLAPLLLKSRGIEAAVVGLANKEIRVYNDSQLVSSFVASDVVLGAVFGRFGREEHTLILALRSGGLEFKILPRTSTLTQGLDDPDRVPEQDIPLDLPKKSKLFLEQGRRERDNVFDIHRLFQRDLYRLRVSTARAYVDTLREAHIPISAGGGGVSVKLEVDVSGLGAPYFRVCLRVTNTGTRPLPHISFVTVFDETLHRPQPLTGDFPVLIPGNTYKAHVDVYPLMEENTPAGVVKFYLTDSPRTTVPLVTGSVSLPVPSPLTTN